MTEIITLDTTRIDIATLIDPPRWPRVRSRQALIDRMRAVNIDGDKGRDENEDLRKTYIHGWELQILDDLDDFLTVTKLRLDQYSSDWREQVASKINSPDLDEVRRSPNLDAQQPHYDQLIGLLSLLSQTTNADNNLERLDKYALNRWWNTGKAFGEMCGIKQIPRNGYKAYGFKFVKVSPKSKWWRVYKDWGEDNSDECISLLVKPR